MARIPHPSALPTPEMGSWIAVRTIQVVRDGEPITLRPDAEPIEVPEVFGWTPQAIGLAVSEGRIQFRHDQSDTQAAKRAQKSAERRSAALAKDVEHLEEQRRQLAEEAAELEAKIRRARSALGSDG